MPRPSRSISVWQNERYTPVSGFSSQGLMIADRGAFSTEDGSVSWPSLEAASLSYISPGWRWVEGASWKIDASMANVSPEDGWEYGVNFGSISSSSSPNKGLSHFVRRRKYIRSQEFVVEDICNTRGFTCDHCEVEEVRRLSEQLLNALASASLILHGEKFSELDMHALKTKMVEGLQLQIDVPLGLNIAMFTLQKFAFPDRSVMSRVSSMMSSSNPLGKLPERSEELANNGFLENERQELAKLIIRKHDSDFRAHCSKPNCGESCEFFTLACPNEGCSHTMSRKWAASHDAECPWKIIDCDRECGEKVLRKDHENHKLISCSLRPVKCPFSMIGCVADLKHREVEQHLLDCTQGHLLMSLQVVMDQQTAIQSLTKQVHALEVELSSYGIKLASAAAGAAAAVEGIRSVEKALHGAQADITKGDKAANKRIDELRNEVVSGLNELKHGMRVTSSDILAIKTTMASSGIREASAKSK